MKSIRLPLFAITLLWTPLTAFAFVTAALDGVYVEGNAGKSFAINKKYPGRIFNSGFGWNVNAGYKFMEYLGVEAGYTRYADTRILNSAGTAAAADTHYSYDLVAKLFFPLWGSGFEFFGKLGLARIHSFTHVINTKAAALNHFTFKTGTNMASAPYFGGGLDYSILPNLQANVQWIRAKGTSHTGNLDLYSAGLSFLY